MRIIVAAVVLLLFPGTAAAATWSQPQRVSGAHTFVTPLGISTAGSGRTLAGWSFQNGLGNAATLGAADASRAAGAGAFGASHALPATTAAIATAGKSGALLATVNPKGTRLSVRFGSAKGTFGKAKLIRRGVQITRPSLAVNSHGDAALVWFENRGVRTDRVYVALRRAGHAFGAPRRLFTGRVRSTAAAVGDGRDVLVAWDARGVLKTRFKPHTRSSFLKTDTIRSDQAFFADLHPVVTPSGRAVLAWSAQFLSEGGSEGPVFFEAAVRVTHAKRFRPAQLLEKIASPVSTVRPIDAVASAFDVRIAWTGAGGVLRTTTIGQSGKADPPLDLGPGFLSDLASDRRTGRTVAVWDDGVDAARSTIHAAVADVAKPFGAPETVSAPTEDAHFGIASFAAGEPTVLYAGRVVPTQFFAETAARTG